ncbi:hypothetical protein HKBW3S03_01836, partial [Candidatus Hakubella thermalkaliphila]
MVLNLSADLKRGSPAFSPAFILAKKALKALS